MGEARRFVRRALAEWGQIDLVDTAVLLTSELVTNAVVHAGTDIDVTCRVGGTSVEVEVRDQYSARSMPLNPPNAELDAEGGRGLNLTARLASSWGVEYTPTSKSVWFRLDDGEMLAEPQPTEEVGLPKARTGDSRPAPDPRIAVLRTDEAGLVCYWSEEATSLFGWAQEQVLGRPLTSLVRVHTSAPDAAAGVDRSADVDRAADAAATADVSGTAGVDRAAGADLTEGRHGIEANDTDMLLRLPRWQGAYDMRTEDGHTVPVFASHLRTGLSGRSLAAVCVLVPEHYRWVLESSAVRQPESGVATPDRSRTGVLGRGGGQREPLSREGVEPLLQGVCEQARDLMDCDVAYALLLTDEEEVGELRASTGLRQRIQPGRRVKLPDGELGSGSARLPVVRDRDAEAAMPLPSGTGMQSLVTVPLVVEERLVGTLGVASRDVAAFGSEDAMRLQSLADHVALAVERARLTELDQRRRGWLGFLAEASDLLAGTLDPDMTMAMVAQLVVPRLARWCAMHVPAEDGSDALAYVWHEDEGQLDWLRDQLTDRPSPPLSHESEPGSPSTLTVALAARGRRIGTLTLGRATGSSFRREDVELVEDLARRAGLALDNARLYDERTRSSQTLQRSLLPPGLPEVPGCDVGVAYAAAGEGNEVGGDFYDLFPIAAGRWGFAIGDVCGKGPEAAAVTGLARHALRLLARKGDPVPDVLTQLNDAVLEEAGGDRFITILYGEIHPQPDGTTRLVMVSAGHPLPLLLYPDGEVRTWGTPQPLIGVLDEVTYQAQELVLAPGETFVAVTDGVTERRGDEEMFGESGLVRALRDARGWKAAAVAAHVEQAVLEYLTSAPRDDMAVLVLRALPGTPPRTSAPAAGELRPR